MIGVLPPGTRGVDMNFVVDSGIARSIYAKGYRFVIRYVGRVQQKPHDLSALEVTRLRRNGLAVGVVQHVKSAESWDPEGASLGKLYGTNAARFAAQCGYAKGAVLWCDMEGVARGTPAKTVIAYNNAWYDAVREAGYDPGNYLGWRSGLSAYDWYWRVKCRRNWMAYNSNRDEYPVVRGAQMRQFAATNADRIPGIDWLSAIDVDIAGKDALGDSPVFMLATGDR